jgi:hypothetical protein
MVSTASTTTSTGFTDFVLAELRCASLRASLLVAEAEAIAVALRGKFISTDAAIEWANDVGLTLAST